MTELSENSELRAATIDQAKSTGYYIQLRVWPEFDLIRPARANRLIVGSKTVRTIVTLGVAVNDMIVGDWLSSLVFQQNQLLPFNCVTPNAYKFKTLFVHPPVKNI